MGDDRPLTTLSSFWPPDLSEPEAVSPPRLAASSRFVWTMRVVGLLVLASIVGGSLVSDTFLSSPAARVVNLIAILCGAVGGFLVAAYSRRRSVEMERAYSTHLETMSRRLRSLAYRDSLTGLYNHRYFREQLSNELERAQRYGSALSILLLDVDHFKDVNDTYGHLMGDTLLSYVAQLIASSVRASDIAARYGGDEFAIVLPETDRQAARATARKLAEIISAARHWQGALLEGLGVGVSAGVATFPEDGRTADELLVAADAALYESKSKVKGQRPSRRRRRSLVQIA